MRTPFLATAGLEHAEHAVGDDVAPCRVGRTEEHGKEADRHLQRIFRLVGEVVFCFDGDKAGRGAAWRALENAVADMTKITGQKPQVTKARKSIAQFKLREGQPIGCHVTLRGDRMWEFLDRLLSLALPRIRDFRGLSDRQFDGHGNYTFGLTEQSVFHEIDQDKIDRVRGMDITVVTTAKNDDQGRALLRELGFPFKAN